MTITSAQRKAVGAGALPVLKAMWEQRRRWWVNHLRGHLDREALAATRAAKLHADLRSRTGLPDLMIREWEKQWDAWFEAKLQFLKPNPDPQRLARDLKRRLTPLLGDLLATEVSNNVAAAFVGYEDGDEDMPSLSEALRSVLVQRMRHGHRFRAGGDQLTLEAIDEAVEAVQDLEP